MLVLIHKADEARDAAGPRASARLMEGGALWLTGASQGLHQASANLTTSDGLNGDEGGRAGDLSGG